MRLKRLCLRFSSRLLWGIAVMVASSSPVWATRPANQDVQIEDDLDFEVTVDPSATAQPPASPPSPTTQRVTRAVPPQQPVRAPLQREVPRTTSPQGQTPPKRQRVQAQPPQRALPTPVAPKPVVSVRVLSPPPQKAVQKRPPVPSRKSNRVKKDEISEIYKMRMEVADLMKRVKAVERANVQKARQPQKRRKKKDPDPSLSEAVEESLGQKVISGNDKIKLALSGHVNRAVLHINNGQAMRLKHVDNDNSPSRFRMVGEGHVNPCLKVGGRVELQVEENSSIDVDTNNDAYSTHTTLSVRKAEFYAKHSRLGDVYIGHGPTATEDVAEQDLSGTYLCTQASGIEGPAGSVRFVDREANARTTIRIQDAWSGMDGNGFKNRVRYDTPQILGVKVGTSHTSSDSWDVGAKFRGRYNGFGLAAAAGFVKRHRANKDGFKQWSGSVSAIVPFGLNATFAAARQDFKKSGRKTARYWLARLGIKVDPFKVGYTALAVDYGKQYNRVNGGNTSVPGDPATGQIDYGNGGVMSTYGLSLVQRISKIATELYATVRKYKLERVPDANSPTGDSRDFKDIWIAMAGARIKF